MLDGDSGKPAGVAVRFLSLRSKPLMRIVNLIFVSARNDGLSAQASFALCLFRYAPNRSKVYLRAKIFCT
jgi:hypothetical protein